MQRFKIFFYSAFTFFFVATALQASDAEQFGLFANKALSGTYLQRLHQLFNNVPLLPNGKPNPTYDPSLGTAKIPSLDDFDVTPGKSFPATCLNYKKPNVLERGYQFVSIETGDSLVGFKKYSAAFPTQYEGKPVSANVAQAVLQSFVGGMIIEGQIKRKSELVENQVQGFITSIQTATLHGHTCTNKGFWRLVVNSDSTRNLINLYVLHGDCNGDATGKLWGACYGALP